MTDPVTLREMCGQLIIGGFAGPELSPSFRAALGRGERGGAILFRRNLTSSFADAADLNRSIVAAARPGLPPLLGVDQEGGRVTRFGPPLLRLPSMRALGRVGDASLVERAATALARELAALGFTMDFAPVLDVDTCDDNPIIGDRAFSRDPEVVARLGAAFVEGLRAGEMMACGKHFPGHGDTSVDSHLDLPRVDQPAERLHETELAPFRHLARSGCDAFMTAHVVYTALDPDEPATLSRRIAHDLLRTDLRYDGLLISDDLEMRAVADRLPIEESSVKAVRAGCDMLLICASEELQSRAHEALVRAAEEDGALRAQIVTSVARGLRARRKRPPRPLPRSALSAVIDGAASRGARDELERRGVFA